MTANNAAANLVVSLPAPSSATVASSILVKDANANDIWSELLTKIDLPLTDIMGADRVIGKLLREDRHKIFHKPVQVTSAIADYHERVPHPMDFSTVRKKLQSAQYLTWRQFYDDLQLTYDNCILYNGEDHTYSKLGVQLLLKTRSYILQAIQQWEKDRLHFSSQAQKLALKLVTYLRSHNYGQQFSVKLSTYTDLWEDYQQRIAKPMDLSTINEKVVASQYGSFDEFADDVRLVFTNCIEYWGQQDISLCAHYLLNEAELRIQESKFALDTGIARTGVAGNKNKSRPFAKPPIWATGVVGSTPVPTTPVTPSTPNANNVFSAGASVDSNHPVTPSSPFDPSSPPTLVHQLSIGAVPLNSPDGRPQLTAEEYDKCYNVIKSLSNNPAHEIFAQPADLPQFGQPLWDYYDVIKKPMDLSTLMRKLAIGAYGSVDSVIADISLIWQNCIKYYSKKKNFEECETLINLATALEADFHSKWESYVRGSKSKKVTASIQGTPTVKSEVTPAKSTIPKSIDTMKTTSSMPTSSQPSDRARNADKKKSKSKFTADFIEIDIGDNKPTSTIKKIKFTGSQQAIDLTTSQPPVSTQPPKLASPAPSNATEGLTSSNLPTQPSPEDLENLRLQRKAEKKEAKRIAKMEKKRQRVEAAGLIDIGIDITGNVPNPIGTSSSQLPKPSTINIAATAIPSIPLVAPTAPSSFEPIDITSNPTSNNRDSMLISRPIHRKRLPNILTLQMRKRLVESALTAMKRKPEIAPEVQVTTSSSIDMKQVSSDSAAPIVNWVECKQPETSVPVFELKIERVSVPSLCQMLKKVVVLESESDVSEVVSPITSTQATVPVAITARTLSIACKPSVARTNSVLTRSSVISIPIPHAASWYDLDSDFQQLFDQAALDGFHWNGGWLVRVDHEVISSTHDLPVPLDHFTISFVNLHCPHATVADVSIRTLSDIRSVLLGIPTCNQNSEDIDVFPLSKEHLLALSYSPKHNELRSETPKAGEVFSSESTPAGMYFPNDWNAFHQFPDAIARALNVDSETNRLIFQDDSSLVNSLSSTCPQDKNLILSRYHSILKAIQFGSIQWDSVGCLYWHENTSGTVQKCPQGTLNFGSISKRHSIGSASTSPRPQSQSHKTEPSLIRSLRNSVRIKEFRLAASSRKFYRPKSLAAHSHSNASPVTTNRVITLPMTQLHLYSLCGAMNFTINGERYVYSSYRPKSVLVSQRVQKSDAQNDPLVTRLLRNEQKYADMEVEHAKALIDRWPSVADDPGKTMHSDDMSVD